MNPTGTAKDRHDKCTRSDDKDVTIKRQHATNLAVYTNRKLKQLEHKNKKTESKTGGNSAGIHETCAILIGNNKYIFKDVLGVGNCAFEAIRQTGAIPKMSVQELRREICEYAR